jgi:hypothetical protein
VHKLKEKDFTVLFVTKATKAIKVQANKFAINVILNLKLIESTHSKFLKFSASKEYSSSTWTPSQPRIKKSENDFQKIQNYNLIFQQL